MTTFSNQIWFSWNQNEKNQGVALDLHSINFSLSQQTEKIFRISRPPAEGLREQLNSINPLFIPAVGVG